MHLLLFSVVMNVYVLCILQNSSSSCNTLCGPWVADGSLATHTHAEWGTIEQTFVAVDVQVDFLGLNFIIAHLRVGNMQIALGKPIEVISPRGMCFKL